MFSPLPQNQVRSQALWQNWEFDPEIVNWSKSNTYSQQIHLGLFLFLLVHAPLALLLRSSRQFATLHALGILALGMAILILDRDSDRVQRRILLLVTYSVGAEVLWRMSGAQIFWEYGKYATIALLGGALLRRPRPLRLHPMPILFFLLLLPSAVLLINENRDQARDFLSFNLSGPLSLAVAALFFYELPLDSGERRHLILIFLAPVVAVATLAVYSTVTATEIVWTTESNFTTSGGFGPNQVSSLLGLAIVLCWYLVVAQPRWHWTGLIYLGLMLWFIAQAMLTFSRTGIYSAGASILAMSPFLLLAQSREAARHARQIFLLLVVILGATLFLILPRLDQFTEGFLSKRFAETSTTGREELSQVQLQLWQQNPISGVGPGKSKEALTEAFGIEVASHTEVTRLLAEHGLFGLLALFVLFSAGLWRMAAAPPGLERALVVAMLACAAVYLLASAMRTVAPSFIYGLTWATLVSGTGVQTGAQPIKSIRTADSRVAVSRFD